MIIVSNIYSENRNHTGIKEITHETDYIDIRG